MNTSGWCYYLGQSDQNVYKSGNGKSLLKNGSVFVGTYKTGFMEEGNLYELQPDGTYSLFNVKYDNVNDSQDDLSGPSQ